MAKIKFAKSESYNDNDKNAILFAEATMLPYTITITNYTTKITSEFMNVNFAPSMDKQAFIAGAMIKRDIKATGLTVPDLYSTDLEYFKFSPKETLINMKGEFYNIDIKSAYASVLHNLGLITPNTFKYMSRLSKKNRLACVGMLAAKKTHRNMIGKEQIGKPIIEVNELAPWFYLCVNHVNEIMMQCKSLCEDSFMFFWVDGIFFKDFSAVGRIGRYLSEIGYKYSIDICTEGRYSESNNTKTFSYYKGDEPKQLFLPNKNDAINEFLIKMLSL